MYSQGLYIAEVRKKFNRYVDQLASSYPRNVLTQTITSNKVVNPPNEGSFEGSIDVKRTSSKTKPISNESINKSSCRILNTPVEAKADKKMFCSRVHLIKGETSALFQAKVFAKQSALKCKRSNEDEVQNKLHDNGEPRAKLIKLSKSATICEARERLIEVSESNYFRHSSISIDASSSPTFLCIHVFKFTSL